MSSFPLHVALKALTFWCCTVIIIDGSFAMQTLTSKKQHVCFFINVLLLTTELLIRHHRVTTYIAAQIHTKKSWNDPCETEILSLIVATIYQGKFIM